MWCGKAHIRALMRYGSASPKTSTWPSLVPIPKKLAHQYKKFCYILRQGGWEWAPPWARKGPQTQNYQFYYKMSFVRFWRGSPKLGKSQKDKKTKDKKTKRQKKQKDKKTNTNFMVLAAYRTITAIDGIAFTSLFILKYFHILTSYSNVYNRMLTLCVFFDNWAPELQLGEKAPKRG